jgi:hypothetical protein
MATKLLAKFSTHKLKNGEQSGNSFIRDMNLDETKKWFIEYLLWCSKNKLGVQITMEIEEI